MALGLSPISGGPIGSTTADVSVTKARVSQAVAEVLRTNTAVEARASHAVIEILRQNNAESPIVEGEFFASRFFALFS